MRVTSPQPIRWKQATFHGITLDVPMHHHYIAADSSGWVYSFATEPQAGLLGMWHSTDKTLMDLCCVDLEGMPWQDTLVELS